MPGKLHRRFPFSAIVSLLVLALASASAPAAADAGPKLPGWFPAQGTFSIGGSLVYQAFGEGSFSDAKGKTVHYRGAYWKAGVWLPKRHPGDWKEASAAVIAGLKRQGYVVDYHHQGSSVAEASFHKGRGDGSWHVAFSTEKYNSGSLAIVRQGPLPVKLRLQPPAAKPVSVGKKADFPYLAPLPGCQIFATQRDPTSMDYEPAKGDTIKVFGDQVAKRYNCPSTHLSQLELELVYESALTRAGWTLGEKNADQGFVYAHYDKNGRNIYVNASVDGDGIALVAAEPPPKLKLLLKPPTRKPERFGDKDAFPYLTPLPGWRLSHTKHSSQPLLVYGANGAKGELVGSGSISKVYLEDKPFPNDQFELAYEQALAKAGWTIGDKKKEQGFLYAHYDKNGRDIWVYLYRSEHPTFTVSDVGTGLKAALAKGCKVPVYGVNFDFNKATLRPDAKPVLEQVLALFKDDRALKVEIGGHTDNVGQPRYNQKLSERRAAAVRAWLIAHGVAASRLTSRGYGDSRPLVPNNSAAHRARNRRVELKKPGCK